MIQRHSTVAMYLLLTLVVHPGCSDSPPAAADGSADSAADSIGDLQAGPEAVPDGVPVADGPAGAEAGPSPDSGPPSTAPWAVSVGGSEEDEGIDIAADAAGNACVAGYFTKQAAFGTFTLTGSGKFGSTTLKGQSGSTSDIYVWKRGTTGP